MEYYYSNYKVVSNNHNNKVSKAKPYKKKVLRFVLFSTLVLSSFMFGAYFDVFAKSNDTPEMSSIEMAATYEMQTSQVLDSIEENLRTVDVEQGDSLWGIAQTYAPEGANVREYMNQIKHKNELPDHLIYAGQLLYLP